MCTLSCRPASRSSSQSATSPTTAARLARMVAGRVCRGCGAAAGRASARRAAAGKDSSPRRCPTPRGADGTVGMPRCTAVVTPRTSGAWSPRLVSGIGCSRVEARIWARCTVRVPARIRDRPPPMCIRQELSPAVQTSAPVSSTCRILSASIAVEVSAFLIAKVPPNPQHSSAPRQLDQLAARRPRAAAAAACRPPAASAASGRSGGRSPGAGSRRRRRSRPSTSTSSSDSS